MAEPLLRIPPFPGHRAPPLAVHSAGASAEEPQSQLAEALRNARVGGTFWGAQPPIPPGCNLLLAPGNRTELAGMIAALSADERARAVVLLPEGHHIPCQLPTLTAPVDPWWLTERVQDCLCDPGSELALIATLSGCRVRSLHGQTDKAAISIEGLVETHILAWHYRDPFTGLTINPEQAIALLAEWRRLIDANRTVAGIYGIAGWKRITADAMLWDGSGLPRHRCRPPEARHSAERYLAWKSRTRPALLNSLHATGAPIGEIEDGFIRSVGLGANCVPPLSLIVDFAGIYFDPSGPSDLETILESADIPPALCGRAAELRRQLVAGAVSKYGQGGSAISRPERGPRRVLVTGQVEDDRSIISGGGGTSNLDLLRRARAMEPNAWIIYKPHPDVEAGHRKGHVPLQDALRFADEVHSEAAIIPLIDSVDSLHVITSLSGFEALLRGKQVTTHGVPFYAGWGLTRDLGKIPARRTRQRTLDELVAATLLLYPRYLDPVTRLPCPAEVVVARMAAGQAAVSSPLVKLREWQGRLNRLVQRMRGGQR